MVELGEDPDAVDDLAADDGQVRRGVGNLSLRASEVVAIRHDEVGELSDLEWHSIEQARALDVANITRVVLEDLGERIAAGALLFALIV